jgi:hypothetical protein
MELKTTGMEFASEMIMEAGARDLTIKEIPITYHPRQGEATLDSFEDGWRHVKFMLTNAPGYLFSAPGLVLMTAGLIAMLVSFFDLSIAGRTFGINSMIAGSLFTLVGFQVACFGALATVAGNPIRKAQDPITKLLTTRLKLEQGALAGLVVFALGSVYMSTVAARWLVDGFAAVPVAKSNVLGLTAIVLGIQLVFTSFLLGALER